MKGSEMMEVGRAVQVCCSKLSESVENYSHGHISLEDMNRHIKAAKVMTKLLSLEIKRLKMSLAVGGAES